MGGGKSKLERKLGPKVTRSEIGPASPKQSPLDIALWHFRDYFDSEMCFPTVLKTKCQYHWPTFSNWPREGTLHSQTILELQRFLRNSQDSCCLPDDLLYVEAWLELSKSVPQAPCEQSPPFASQAAKSSKESTLEQPSSSGQAPSGLSLPPSSGGKAEEVLKGTEQPPQPPSSRTASSHPPMRDKGERDETAGKKPVQPSSRGIERKVAGLEGKLPQSTLLSESLPETEKVEQLCWNLERVTELRPKAAKRAPERSRPEPSVLDDVAVENNGTVSLSREEEAAKGGRQEQKEEKQVEQEEEPEAGAADQQQEHGRLRKHDVMSQGCTPFPMRIEGGKEDVASDGICHPPTAEGQEPEHSLIGSLGREPNQIQPSLAGVLLMKIATGILPGHESKQPTIVQARPQPRAQFEAYSGQRRTVHETRESREEKPFAAETEAKSQCNSQTQTDFSQSNRSMNTGQELTPAYPSQLCCQASIPPQKNREWPSTHWPPDWPLQGRNECPEPLEGIQPKAELEKERGKRQETAYLSAAALPEVQVQGQARDAPTANPTALREMQVPERGQMVQYHYLPRPKGSPTAPGALSEPGAQDRYLLGSGEAPYVPASQNHHWLGPRESYLHQQPHHCMQELMPPLLETEEARTATQIQEGAKKPRFAHRKWSIHEDTREISISHTQAICFCPNHQPRRNFTRS